MSDRQRHRAFALSALFVIAVCALVWLLERPPSGGGATTAPATRTRSPLVLGAEAGEPSAGKAPIVATARRFATAFVTYEVGRLPTGVRRAIQSTATPSFASSLLSAPPSLPNGVRPPLPPQVRSVTLAGGPEMGHAEVTVELREAGGETNPLTERLSRMGQEWRISGLG